MKKHKLNKLATVYFDDVTIEVQMHGSWKDSHHTERMAREIVEGLAGHR